MRIRKVKLLGARSFRLPFEAELYDEWKGESPPAFLAYGPNGSGKTTFLEVIAELWDYFGKGLDKKPSRGKETAAGKSDLLRDVCFAGIQIEGLFPDQEEPTWLFVVDESSYADYKSQIEAPYIGSVRVKRSREIFATHSDAFLARFAEQRERILQGREKDFPNVVFIPSEGRVLGPPPKHLTIRTGESENNWIARYDARREDIGSLLYELRASDTEAFRRVCNNVNSFLAGKRVTDFSPDQLLEVECGAEPFVERHSVYELGSGEKQVLLLLAFVDRWLRPGGVLLIDEPDLHLHVSVTMQLVDSLRQIVTKRRGQLIFTSHSPEVWKEFPRKAEQVNLGMVQPQMQAGTREEGSPNE